MEPATVPSLAVLAALAHVKAHEKETDEERRATKFARELLREMRPKRWGSTVQSSGYRAYLSKFHRFRWKAVPSGVETFEIVPTRRCRPRHAKFGRIKECFIVDRVQDPDALYWTRSVDSRTARSAGVTKRWISRSCACVACKGCGGWVCGPTEGGLVEHECSRRGAGFVFPVRRRFLFPALG